MNQSADAVHVLASARGSFGHFANDAEPYVITNPDTPRAFDNFLWNDSVMACVQQTGVGYCDIQIGDAQAISVYTGVGRICDVEAYGRDHLMSRLVYIRDNQTGAFWNLGWEPVCHAFESYACEHNLGSTRITSVTAGIQSTLELLVPPGASPVELWRLGFANASDQSRDLSIFVYNQYALGYKWGFDSYGDMLYRGAWYEPAINGMIVQKHPFIAPHDYLTAFLAASRTPDGHDGSRRHFVGDYATLAAPRAVVEGQCSNAPGSCEATIAALQFNLRLAPGQTQAIELVGGLVNAPEQARQLADAHLGRFEDHLQEIQTRRAALVQHQQVSTPDGHFNRMVNGWLKQQCLFGATWCRWGYMGFRDIVQHGMGICDLDPQRTRAILLKAMAHVRQSGLALRGWNPVDTKAYSDSCLWLVYTLTRYLKETGDFALLDEQVAWYDAGHASVLEHVETALRFLEEGKGSHGLCLIRYGDWNDSLTNIGREGRGESVWLSMAYVYALEQMALLYEHLEKPPLASEHRTRAATMRQAIARHAWDGHWFLRCFDDRGLPVGSHQNEEGRIYLNAQSWAMLCGVADASQQAMMLSACREHLLTESGYRVLAPPYTRRDDHLGRITYLEPGICENGTVYSHVNAFLCLAQLQAGLAEEAWETFTLLTPGYVGRTDGPKAALPPYIYANGYYAPEHRNNPLQAEFTWVTGSVAWWRYALCDYMLGVRAGYDCLTIEPVLAAHWPEVRMERTWRGCHFSITMRRTGEPGMRVNGTSWSGREIPLAACRGHNIIEVAL